MNKNEAMLVIRLDKELHKKLKMLCVNESCTMQNFIEKMIKEALKNGY